MSLIERVSNDGRTIKMGKALIFPDMHLENPLVVASYQGHFEIRKELDRLDSENKDNIFKIKTVVEYCYDNLHLMWAAKTVSILLGCDFREAKDHSDIFLLYCEEIGI